MIIHRSNIQMKKLTAAIIALSFISVSATAQCEKKLTITSSKTEYLNEDTALQKTVEENTIIEINKPLMTISPGTKKMVATITSETCTWKTPYVEGITVYKVTFEEEEGKVKNATVIIEGKGSGLTMLVTPEGEPYMIRVPIDKFEEKIK